MFVTPHTPQEINAEIAYRQERIRREFGTAKRRGRAKRAEQAAPRARHALRFTKAA